MAARHYVYETSYVNAILKIERIERRLGHSFVLLPQSITLGRAYAICAEVMEQHHAARAMGKDIYQ